MRLKREEGPEVGSLMVVGVGGRVLISNSSGPRMNSTSRLMLCREIGCMVRRCMVKRRRVMCWAARERNGAS